MSIQNVEVEQIVFDSLLLDGELVKGCQLTEIQKIREDEQPLDFVALLQNYMN